MTAARLVWLAVMAALAVQNRPGAADAKARQLVDQSRAAVEAQAGGRELRSLLLRGRVRVPQEGSAFEEGQVEIRIRLPDRFLRLDTVGTTTRRVSDRDLFARFMLGAAAYVVPQAKLTIRSTGEEAFEGTAAVDVSGPSFSARLVLEHPSLIPLRLMYFPGGSISTVMSFADRRPAGGFLLPFRVSTQTPQRVLEALQFDDVVVNPPLTEADFKP